VQDLRLARSLGKSAVRAGTTQFFRLECASNAAISHCRRVARPDARRDRRRRARRLDD
jgi:hypothetical protein